MKIILSESQVNNLKDNLNEQGLGGIVKLLGRTKLGSKVGSKIASILRGGEQIAAKSVVKGLQNPNNYKTVNGKGFVIADNGAEISINAINSMVDDIAYGRVTVDQALSNFPKKLKDGTDFKQFFDNIPKKQPAVAKSSGVEKSLGNAGKSFREKYKNTDWVQVTRPINEMYSGWKFHVYADTIDEAAYLFETLLPVVKKHNAGFKIAGGEMLKRLSSNPDQMGKGVTIYISPTTFKKNMVNTLFNDIKSAVSSYNKSGSIVGDKMLTKNIGFRYELSKPINPTDGIDFKTYLNLYSSNRGATNYNIEGNKDILHLFK